MARYNTNLAAEFYILSCLHRLGFDANLTLGNKKGVDIIVARDADDAVTVEVKGLAGKYEWPADNLVTKNPDNHFVVLVSFEGRIDEAKMPPPRVWIIPFREVERFKRAYRTRTNVSRAAVLAEGGEFENAWRLIAGTAEKRKYKRDKNRILEEFAKLLPALEWAKERQIQAGVEKEPLRIVSRPSTLEPPPKPEK